MKFYCFELEPSEEEFIKKKFESTLDLVFNKDPINADNADSAKDADGLLIFINSKVDKAVIDKLPNLKFIATMSTGFDHIDIEACKARNIAVSTVPMYGENTVAEHAFALIFAISRKLVESVERVKQGNFSPQGLTGFDLFGLQIGVVGVGNIGTHVIRIAKGVGMDVIAYKRTPDPKLATDLGFRFVEMDELLRESDIITLHVPYTKETHHMLNEEAFAKMKDGVIIINTARGALIDTGALVNALASGKVAAAGLDVLEGEAMIKEEHELLHTDMPMDDLKTVIEDHMLLTNPKVIITPHNAFNSTEALQRIMNTTAENILNFMAGTPKNTAY